MDPKVLQNKLHEYLEELLPPEYGYTFVKIHYFDDSDVEIEIFADEPGLVMGRKGINSDRIKKHILKKFESQITIFRLYASDTLHNRTDTISLKDFIVDIGFVVLDWERPTSRELEECRVDPASATHAIEKSHPDFAGLVTYLDINMFRTRKHPNSIFIHNRFDERRNSASMRNTLRPCLFYTSRGPELFNAEMRIQTHALSSISNIGSAAQVIPSSTTLRTIEKFYDRNHIAPGVYWYIKLDPEKISAKWVHKALMENPSILSDISFIEYYYETTNLVECVNGHSTKFQFSEYSSFPEIRQFISETKKSDPNMFEYANPNLYFDKILKRKDYALKKFRRNFRESKIDIDRELCEREIKIGAAGETLSLSDGRLSYVCNSFTGEDEFPSSFGMPEDAVGEICSDRIYSPSIYSYKNKDVWRMAFKYFIPRRKLYDIAVPNKSLEDQLVELKNQEKIDREYLEFQYRFSLNRSNVPTRRLAIETIVWQPESMILEKKSTLCVNLKYVDHKTGKLSPKVESKGKENPVETSAMKTISAFGNTQGGKLVIGVADDNSIVGIEADFELKQFPNQDKWELHLKNCLERIKPDEYSKQILINYHQSEGRTICVIECPVGDSVVTYNGIAWYRSGPASVQFTAKQLYEFGKDSV